MDLISIEPRPSRLLHVLRPGESREPVTFRAEVTGPRLSPGRRGSGSWSSVL